MLNYSNIAINLSPTDRPGDAYTRAHTYNMYNKLYVRIVNPIDTPGKISPEMCYKYLCVRGG